MDALAGRPFAKMNGLGNEIVVLDLRGMDIAVTPAQARAAIAGSSPVVMPPPGNDQTGAPYEWRTSSTPPAPSRAMIEQPWTSLRRKRSQRTLPQCASR